MFKKLIFLKIYVKFEIKQKKKKNENFESINMYIEASIWR